MPKINNAQETPEPMKPIKALWNDFYYYHIWKPYIKRISSKKGGIGSYHLIVFLDLEADEYYKKGGIEAVRQEGINRLNKLSHNLDKMGEQLKAHFEERKRIKNMIPEERKKEFWMQYKKQYGPQYGPVEEKN